CFPDTWRTAEEMMAGVESPSRLVTFHDEGKLAGYAFFVHHLGGSEATLEYVGVSPHFRNRGLARKMILAGARHAREHWNDRELSLTVNVENPAIRLYRSMGFATVYDGVGYRAHL